jgi:glycine oxidase
MLAPAFESVLDPAARGQWPLLKEARDLWPAFAETLGTEIGLRRSGAVWLDLPGLPARLESLSDALADAGPTSEVWSRRNLDERAPGLAPHIQRGLFTPDDWRVEPVVALRTLHACARDAGVVFIDQSVVVSEPRAALLADGAALEADALVVATGAAVHALAPELSALSPIKGHILRYPEIRHDGVWPAVRCAAGYANPARDGLRIGATMESGLNDREVDIHTAAPLGRLAHELYPTLNVATPQVQAGVRAAAPDGLPLVGPSAAPGVWLAVGARRNGWLLAPLVAQMTAAYLAGGDPGAHARAFDPNRFALRA